MPLFAGLRDLGIPELGEHLAAYRVAWREAGHAGAGDVCLRIPLYAAPTEAADSVRMNVRREITARSVPACRCARAS